MKVNRILLMIFLVSFCTGLMGQKLTDTLQIREVTIIGQRKVEEAGLKVSRPDSIAMVSSLTTDLSELVTGFTPVFVKSYGKGSPATASFRGTAPSHTQILWNGMNLNSPMRGYADLSLVPVFFTDNLYLLHGGSSMAEGSGALGGSIHLINQPLWADKLFFNVMHETGSYGSEKSFVKFSLGQNRLKLTARAFHERSDNNFSFLNFGVLPNKKDTMRNAGYEKWGVLQELYYRPLENNLLSLKFWYQDNERDLPQLMSYQGSERIENQNDNVIRFQFDWKKYGSRLNYQFFAGFNRSVVDYIRETPEFGFANENSRSRESSFLSHFKFSRKVDPITYFSGSLDINYHEVGVENFLNLTGYIRDRLETSLMIDFHLKPSDRIAGFLLLRSESYDNRIIPLIPAMGAEWQITDKLPLIVQWNLSRNYHKPSLNDLYWLPGGNPELLSEDGYSTDLTLKMDNKGLPVEIGNELTFYLSRIENWIVWQPAGSGAFYWEASNLRDVFSRGLEYEGSAVLTWKKIRFNVSGNYTFTLTSNLNGIESVDKSRGKQLVYIPKNTANLHFVARWKKFSLQYSTGYTGKRYTRSDNAESDYEYVLNPYLLSKISIDKLIEYETMDIGLKFTVENLFNESYQSILWRPMPGRFYSFSTSISFRK